MATKPKIPFIRASGILTYGSERNRWAYAARELRTAQTALLRRHHKRALDELPGSAYVYGWVTDRGRPLGIGYQATSQGRKYFDENGDEQHERVCRVELPIANSGVQLQEEALGHLVKMDRKAAREKRARQKRKNFKVVKAA